MKKAEYKTIIPHNIKNYGGIMIVKTRKTGRNEPCPCGNTYRNSDGDLKPLKFKKCCLEL